MGKGVGHLGHEEAMEAGGREFSLHGRVVKGVGHLGHEEAMEAGDWSSASVAEWLRAWDTSAMMKLRRREVVSSASMAEWLRAWDTLAMMKLWRREVVSLIPDRGAIVG